MTQAIDRSEGAGLGISLLVHLLVLGALSVSFLAETQAPPKAIPIDISLAEDVGMESAAPVVSHAALAAKKSPVEAPVEPDSEPAPAPESQPLAKPQPAPPKPAPEPKPEPEPRPQPPHPRPAPAEKPGKVPAATASTAHAHRPRPVRPTGNLDGLDLGRSNNKTNSTATNNPAAVASSTDVASFRGLIARQIQPCANRQVTPGPGAERLRVLLRVSFDPDGSLNGDPVITGVQGKDGENARYVERVKDLAIATFKGCTPVHGLPASLYGVPNGWKSLAFSYKLPG